MQHECTRPAGICLGTFKASFYRVDRIYLSVLAVRSSFIIYPYAVQRLRHVCSKSFDNYIDSYDIFCLSDWTENWKLMNDAEMYNSLQLTSRWNIAPLDWTNCSFLFQPINIHRLNYLSNSTRKWQNTKIKRSPEDWVRTITKQQRWRSLRFNSKRKTLSADLKGVRKSPEFHYRLPGSGGSVLFQRHRGRWKIISPWPNNIWPPNLQAGFDFQVGRRLLCESASANQRILDPPFTLLSLTYPLYLL